MTEAKIKKVENPEEINDWIDTVEAAEICDLRKGTLVQWRSDGIAKLPYYKIGRSILYRESEVRAFAKTDVYRVEEDQS